MLINSVKPGESVQITLKSGAVSQGPYTTKVEVIENAQSVLLQPPVMASRADRLDTTSAYGLSFISDGSMINYNARLAGYTRLDGIEVLRFTLQGEGQKVQRRGSFRFTCSLPMEMHIISEDGEVGPPLQAIIRDLSGGGMRVTSNETLPMNSLLRLLLPVTEKEPLIAFGEVRMARPSNDSKQAFQYGIEFSVMPQADQERIIRFVYSEQRKTLKRTRNA